MNNKYYLDVRIEEQRNASSKAVKDCNSILRNMGFQKLDMNIKKDGNPYVKKIHNGLQFYQLMHMKKDSILVVPHPIYINKKYMDILGNMKRKRNVKLIFLIHDLESVRQMFPDQIENFRVMDETMFSIADAIIAHNDKMIAYLKQQGVKAKLFNLQLFDYLCKPNTHEKTFSPTLSIAGNLDVIKCKYIGGLRNVSKEIAFKLYGVNFDDSLSVCENISYQGSFPADEIQLQFDSGFGLVWDGDSEKTCGGPTGAYLRYNNPHKLSLYLASGLPVVVWSEAAESKFVMEHQVGIAVDSIDDFKNKVGEMNEEQYQEMVRNAKVVSEKVQDGYYLKTVMREVLENI